MSMLKRLVRIAAGAVLATGILAGTAAPAADAAPSVHGQKPIAITMDTGWGP